MLTLGTKVICSGGRYGYSLQSGRGGKCRVTLRAGRRIGYPLLSQPTPWKGLEQGMRPGTRRPRSPTVSPTPAPPAFARRGAEPSLVPHAEGYLEPAPGPATSGCSRSSATTSAAAAANAALRAAGRDIRPSLRPGAFLPSPDSAGPLPGPRLPDFIFRVTLLYRCSPRPQGRDVEGWPARGPEGAWAPAWGPRARAQHQAR